MVEPGQNPGLLSPLCCIVSNAVHLSCLGGWKREEVGCLERLQLTIYTFVCTKLYPQTEKRESHLPVHSISFIPLLDSCTAWLEEAGECGGSLQGLWRETNLCSTPVSAFYWLYWRFNLLSCKMRIILLAI